MIDTSLLEASVFHKRHFPREHSFVHKVFFVILNLKDFESPNKKRFFSLNKFNIFSLYFGDYGFDKKIIPRDYINQTLAEFSIDPDQITNVSLITMPRFLGFVFNPISFWMCFNHKDELVAILAEVNNTFGERHGYLCFNKDLEPITKSNIITRDKIFHVSPFCQVKGSYDFSFSVENKNINIVINYKQDEKMLISTSIQGNITKFSDKNLLKCLFSYPLFTLKVILLIHYHALRLWIKKVPFFKKPQKPEVNIS